jgi:prolyl-tRNA editing enzyme YbaK/EbsC (Cys-tRNA(Pro) deacylase)
VPETTDPAGIQRVRDAAARKGVDLDIRVFDESTHTAADAAMTVDAELGQIVKSLVFVAAAEDGALEPIICLVSGPNRVDLARLTAVTGARDIRRATAREAQELTGFSIGGIPPFGHVRSGR